MIGVFICLCLGICEGMKKSETESKKELSTQQGEIRYSGYLFTTLIYWLWEKYHHNFQVQNFTLLNRNKTLVIIFTYA